jgi:hypothetical protein
MLHRFCFAALKRVNKPIKPPRKLYLKSIEVSIALVFFGATSLLMILGLSASSTNQTLDGAERLSLTKFIGLSTSAWHQELEVFYTLKALSPNESTSLGLREPAGIKRNLVEFIPLRFSNYFNDVSVSDRPYLSSPGIFADIGKGTINFFELLGFSKLFGLMAIYFANALLNGFFVYLLLLFGKEHLSKKLTLSLYRVTVVSPWIILDSTSIMLSPAIRFGGIFTLLAYMYYSRNKKNSHAYICTLIGLVFSTFNGFEFFFFQLSILLVFFLLVFSELSLWKVLKSWIFLTISSWLVSILLWTLTIYSNLKSISDSISLIIYTIFKHSLFRADSTPVGAVTSGDTSLGLLSGLRKLSLEMSIFIPYPFPQTLQSKLGLSDEILAFFKISTSMAVLLMLIFVASQRYFRDGRVFLGILLWCFSAIAVNSYAFNHPHYLPPVGLFLVISIFLYSFRKGSVSVNPDR